MWNLIQRILDKVRLRLTGMNTLLQNLYVRVTKAKMTNKLLTNGFKMFADTWYWKLTNSMMQTIRDLLTLYRKKTLVAAALRYRNMGKLTVYIGSDSDGSLSKNAKILDENAILLTESNLNCLSANDDLVCYTGIEEIPDPNKLYNILKSADLIVYIAPPSWTDTKYNFFDNFDREIFSSPKYAIDYILIRLLKENKNIQNFDLTSIDSYTNYFDKLEDTRKSENRQIWNAGCSHTYGTGVEKHQRYGHLLSEQLELSISFLARPGGHPEWVADQILRSDIRKDDIIIWGLSNPERYTFWSNSKHDVEFINIARVERGQTPDAMGFYSKKELLKRLTDPTLIYQAVSHVKQVVNFCNKIGAKIMIFGIQTPLDFWYYLSDCNYYNFHLSEDFFQSNFVDLGTDNEHPGPKQHQLYAEFCFNKLKMLGYI